jgi:3-oxoacyl-[acyl-carrier-protein] synthase II
MGTAKARREAAARAARSGRAPQGLAVAATGIGVVSPVGVGREEFWSRILAGASGIGPVESFDTSAYRVHLGAEIKGFSPAPLLKRLEPASVGRASQLAAAAARLAVADAGVDLDRVEPERIAVAMGTTSGEPREIEALNDRYLGGGLGETGGDFVARYPCFTIAANVAAELGASGVVTMFPTACAAGNYALAFAFDLLRAGRADLVLAGGADCFSRITYSGFARLGAIAPELCQPFDRNRKGMIPGEGAAVLVLEPLSSALARGARVYAEIAGYGLSCDAYHMTAPHPDGPIRAMEQALATTGNRPEDISYVSAHGTGTPTNDRMEAVAVARVFGPAVRKTPVSSIKSMIGHTMGAASAIEAAACAMAVACDLIPPTINYRDPDPECDLDCVPNVARRHPVEKAMNNAYAFGGNNASVIFAKPRV